MTTLLTHGASATGIAIAKLLVANGRQVVFGSRSGTGIPEEFKDIVKLDWEDPSTFINPFQTASGDARPIDSVYLMLAPIPDADPLQFLGPFVDLSIEKGVKRFILLTASNADPTKSLDAPHAKVHKFLADKGVDYFVLRPTWFIENFNRVQGHGIRAKDEFETPIPTGKIPFVAVQDIAQAAYEAIINERNTVTDKVVIGPEFLTYDEAAAILSDVLGRKITHTAVPRSVVIGRLKAFGIPDDYASIIDAVNESAERGSEVELVNQLPQEKKHIGKITVREWAEKNKALLQSSKA